MYKEENMKQETTKSLGQAKEKLPKLELNKSLETTKDSGNGIRVLRRRATNKAIKYTGKEIDLISKFTSQPLTVESDLTLSCKLFTLEVGEWLIETKAGFIVSEGSRVQKFYEDVS